MKFIFLILFFGFFFGCASSLKNQSQLHVFEVAPQTFIHTWVREAEDPKQTVLLFPGGVFPDSDNYLFHLEKRLALSGFQTIVFKKRSDRKLVKNQYRKGKKHFKDLVKFIKNSGFVRGDLIVVGFSRGTISALNLLQNSEVEVSSLILISPVAKGEAFQKVFKKVSYWPDTSVVYHVDDRCSSSKKELIEKTFGGSRFKKVPIKGGTPNPDQDDCGPYSFHGFESLRENVSKQIVELL